MDQTLQQNFRENLYKKYMERGFEALALYSYWGKRYADVEKTLNEYDARIKDAERKLNNPAADAFKDLSEQQVRDLKKGLRNDIQTYRKILEQMKPKAKSLYEKSVAWREEAIQSMEQADVMKEFKVATPEEIAIERAKAGTTPAIVAEEEVGPPMNGDGE